ncbi:ATP-binding protein [Thermobifida halotolerans]|uniref:ATP-binding protein n=2 Tax=Thermobifida halotolerans TaxID=483545 RepID=A0A399FXW9_9ACTN|nr:ATP-binding protein [Thermobifida halotolerans]
MSDDARGPIQATRTFPGTAENCGRARSWVRSLTLPYPDVRDSVELVASELFTNAIRHTRSGDPGGLVQMTLSTEDDPPTLLRLEITDGGLRTDLPKQVAHALLPPSDAQSGRGLFIASVLSRAWGRFPAHGNGDHLSGAALGPHSGSMTTWVEFSLHPELEMAGSR